MNHEDAHELYSRAFACYQSNKFKEAADFFQTLTVFHPQNELFWTSLGHSYKMAKEYEKALDAYRVSIFVQPDEKIDPLTLLHAAECYRYLRKKDRAVSILQEAVSRAEPALKKRLALILEAWCNKPRKGDKG